MKRSIRTFFKKLLPKRLLIRGWTHYGNWRARRARRAFDGAGVEPAWLDRTDLDRLYRAYPPQRLEYTYDRPTLEARARGRIDEMLRGVPAGERARLRTFLDLGAWDGTSCQMLQELGKTAVGIDIRAEGFTDEARRSGAAFQQMDIDFLAFADDSFDFIFSYNSFEHFPHPDIALREAARVARPGGYIYLNFGPLWYAPKGAHQFKTVGIPYNQCLFTKEMLQEYAAEHGFDLMGFFWMNEWDLARYRELWREMSGRLEPLIYFEEYALEGLELIEAYPSCFRSKSDLFEDFLVSYIEVLFQKKTS